MLTQLIIVPSASQRRLVELHKLEARCKEEMELLIAESIRRIEAYSTTLHHIRTQSALSAGDRALSVIKSERLELQIHQSELVNQCLTQAYWSSDHYEATLLSVKRQCKHEIVLPTQPLVIDNSFPQTLLASAEDTSDSTTSTEKGYETTDFFDSMSSD